MDNCINIIFNNEIIDSVQVKAQIASLQKNILSLKGQGHKLFAIFMERSPELLISMYSSYSAGIAYIPLDPNFPTERIHLILNEAQPDLILTESHLVEKLPANFKRIIASDIMDTGLVTSLESVNLNPEDPAYIIFTSGSTGKPKGVMIPRRAMDNFLNSMAVKPGLTAHDRLLAVTTISFDISVLEIFLPFRVGAEVFLLDKNDSRDPEAIIRALDKHDITVMQATPATWRMMIDAGWKGKRNLKILCGGEALSPELADDLLDRCGELWNMYGPTETTVWSTCTRVERGASISIGEPIDNTDIYILDNNLKPVPQGVEGDLYIGGKGLALGYYNRPDLTEKAFIANPAKKDDIIYKTGDLARYMPDHRLECLGRSDFQVKIRGFRIELGDVESNLMKYRGIKNVVVHPQIVRNGMKELVAYIVAENPIEPPELITFLSESLPDYMVPSYYQFLEKLPLNNSGKIDRKNLPVPRVSEIPCDIDIAGSSLEEKLIHIWKRVLFLDHITAEQNFFEIGGNSILAVQALREMNEICPEPLSLSTFFQHPVIKEMIQEMEKGGTAEDTVILLNGVREGTPLFCLGGIDLFQSLANNITERPVYAVFLPYEEQLIDHIQRDALDDWEYMTIDGMAAAYYREIKKFHATGPCHLLGASIGGMIAFEASRLMLREEGDRGEIFVLDSHLPRAQHFSPIGKIANIVKRLRSKRQESGNIENKSITDMEYIASIRDSINENAESKFDKEAVPIEGDVHLIKAVKNQYSKGETWDSDLGWTPLVQGTLNSYELPGDHLGILREPCVNMLAEYIEHKLGESI